MRVVIEAYYEWKVQLSKIEKYRWQMGKTCVSDHCIFKYDYTWQFDFLAKLGFIKTASPKHAIFERSCKSHQISYVTITNHLWLFFITFIRCNPIVWKPN
jgi:hypothetical protein